MTVLETLRERGFIDQVSAEESCRAFLAANKTSCYIGFDPTGASLHCGHLVTLMALAHLQRAGHRVIAVVGGGTGMIGDPSGKTEMRQLLSADDIAANVEALKGQIGKLVDLEDASKGILVNNADWLTPWSYIDFLREIGRHFTVNRLLASKTYKERFESEQGLSFIEFNYQLLQAYDFLHLYDKEGCHLQLGGADQWGNILAGTDLIRRVRGKEDAFAITFPLITTASGAKMGKTAKGAIWLDGSKTSPFDFFQYWRNTRDDDVARFLKLFTFVPVADINAMTAAGGAKINEAKRLLAFEVTKICHGEAAANKAQAGAEGAADQLPTVSVSKADFAGEGVGVLDVFSKVAGMAKSNGEVRRTIQSGGIYINEGRVDDIERRLTEADFPDGVCLLRFGKKRKKRLVWA